MIVCLFHSVWGLCRWTICYYKITLTCVRRPVSGARCLASTVKIVTCFMDWSFRNLERSFSIPYRIVNINVQLVLLNGEALARLLIVFWTLSCFSKWSVQKICFVRIGIVDLGMCRHIVHFHSAGQLSTWPRSWLRQQLLDTTLWVYQPLGFCSS